MAIGLSKPWVAAPVILFFDLCDGASAHAEVATDGTVGPRVELVGPEFAIGADLGRQAGRNLFHSFDRFSLAAGERATFSSPDQIENVISRVTGGAPSDIDGTIRSTIAGADFYFINPAGILFGPNASLDVTGSFHVSTANELRFRDGATFSATDPAANSFIVARPEAFGFLGGDRGTLSVADSRLRVQPGEAISLVGGDVTIAGGSADEDNPTIGANRGMITVGAVGVEGGQFVLRSGEIDAPDHAAITLTDGAVLATTGNGGGAIRIEGSRLLVENSSARANNNGSLDATGGVAIDADRVTLRDGSRVTADVLASGDGGQVRVDATRVAIRNGSFFGSDVHAGGNGGRVDVEVDSILISGDGAAGFTGMGTDVTAGTGQGGQTTVHARDLRVFDGGEIRASTFDDGHAGSVNVDAGNLELRSGSSIKSDTSGEGNAGPVTVSVRTLLVRDSGFISSSSFDNATGDAGGVTVDARHATLHDGGGIFSSSLGMGDAGAVTVRTTELVARDSGFISAGSFSAASGNAGSVTVEANNVTLRDDSQLNSSNFGVGEGGAVMVTTQGDLSLQGSAVSTSTFGEGNAGTVVITVEGNLTLADLSLVSTSTSGEGNGNAGTVEIKVEGNLTLDNLSFISSNTSNDRNAGTITVTAEALTLRDLSGISSAGFVLESGDVAGPAGDVLLETGTLVIDNSLVATSGATAEGGRITVEAEELIDLFRARVTSDGIVPGEGDSLITVTAPLIAINDSVVTSLTGGVPIEGSGEARILGDSTVISADSEVAASSTLEIRGQETNLGTQLATFEGTLIDTGPLPERCGARRDVGASSFTSAGRGGLPASPDAPLPSAYRGAPSAAGADAEAQRAMLVLAGCASAP